MKKIPIILFVSLLPVLSGLMAQTVDSVRFFTDEAVIEMSLSTDIVKMQREKGEDMYQPATVKLVFPDQTTIEEPILVAPRGHFRREYCNIPPIMVDFKTPTSPRLSTLGKLKLVIGCGTSGNDESLLFKEYLVYKMYNLLEDKSFRVRLVKITYNDTRGKVRPFTQHAFFIEDDKEMAMRNNCIKKGKVQYLTENTDRDLMTKVAIFEYMISNGDWSVPNNHNIRLIYDKENQYALPYVVPYDFDHSGFVNAGYAVPNELLGTEKVTERVYRGFPRKMTELQATLDIFRAKKEAIYALINNFSFLSARTKKELTSYLTDFYNEINDKRQVQQIFIDNARTR